MNQPGKTLSLVIPVYFEELVIEVFYRRVLEALAPLADEFELELIFVNDGSTDRSLGILLALREQDPRVKVLHFSRNFGHQIAVTAGVDHARGDVVVIIDADLQDPPEVILEMVGKWREGYKVLYGVRAERKGENVFKLLTAKLFYRLLGRISDIRIPLDTGDFRLMDRTVVDGLRGMREESRYIRGMVAWLGYRQGSVTYVRDPRFAGQTKYTLSKMFRFAFNGITSFSEKPLVLVGWLGLLVTAGGFAFLVYIIISKLLRPETVVSGWASLMGIVILFGGIQLLSLGILGQYIGRIYREVKHRPLYVLEAAWGWTPQVQGDPGQPGVREMCNVSRAISD
jgi:dolichol-phosphate mannosyltransferase